MPNKNLWDAKKAKNDEFYTRWVDIENEVNAYIEYNPNVFRGKTILLPADDPFESNFFKFFATHFNDYGIKKLISTSYDSSPVVNTQLNLSLFDEDVDGETEEFSKAYKIELTDVSDFDNNGSINILDVEESLKAEKLKLDTGGKSSILSYLSGDENPDFENRFPAGDFRSKEVTRLKNHSDIVITNPPFSLFRTFLKWIEPKKRDLLVLSGKNAMKYKETFPLILENKLWIGATSASKELLFIAPEGADLSKKSKTAIRVEDGVTYLRSPVVWFTTLEHGKRHNKLPLMTMADNIKFGNDSKAEDHKYSHYDNYDAIEVPNVSAIPSDYEGIMGVPITFLDKYNPDQFEILGLTTGRKEFNKLAWPTKRYINAIQHNKDGSETSGSKANTSVTILVDEEPVGKVYYTADNSNKPMIIKYTRILIRKK